jgi:deoxyribose-phosphate aldolase
VSVACSTPRSTTKASGDGATGGSAVGGKASGGIRTLAVALLMIEAGAYRIGASASRAILDAARTELK